MSHLGKKSYTLYAPSFATRQTWCDRILEAKTNKVQALLRHNDEPFELRFVADTAFSYDTSRTGSQSFVVIKGGPLDRAIHTVERMYVGIVRQSPVCESSINCATTFIISGGKEMVAVGTDNGVYISESVNPRGWSKASWRSVLLRVHGTDVDRSAPTKM